MLIPHESYNHLECPKCHKQTIVQQSQDVYSCISCGFRRDLSTPHLGDLGGAIVAIASILLLIAIL